jgi:hypothetical protein
MASELLSQKATKRLANVARGSALLVGLVASYLLLVTQSSKSSKLDALVQPNSTRPIRVFYPKTCLSQEREIELIRRAINEAK